MTDDDPTIKRIWIEPSAKRTGPPTPALPKKRQITATARWTTQCDTTPEQRLEWLAKCFVSDVSACAPVRLLEQQIHSKWYGYRAQDIHKSLFSPEELVGEKEIAELLLDSRLLCFYCRHSVDLFYEYVRESSQWSLERIDNEYGHIRGNVVIACLGCNLRRRTMYYQRFLATKQMTITKR
jgi:hypothetical protein